MDIKSFMDQQQGVFVIHNNNTVEQIATDGPPGLALLQSMVGGYIERVPLSRAPENVIMYCNEQGKLQDRPINNLATALWSQLIEGPLPDVLVGPVVLINGSHYID